MDETNNKEIMLNKIRQAYEEFRCNRTRGCRYPSKIKSLVEEAQKINISIGEISSKTGISDKAMYRWQVVTKRKPKNQLCKLRRLRIVDPESNNKRTSEAAQCALKTGHLIFPTGVKLQLSVDILSLEFLSRLGVIKNNVSS